MENFTTRPASGLDVREKSLDVVLTLLQTVQSLTSIATPTNRRDAGQPLFAGPAQIENRTHALEDDARVRIAVLENELKHERAAKDASLLNLQQVIQLYAPTNRNPHQTSVGLGHFNQIRDLQKLLDESKEENRRLEARFRSELKAGKSGRRYTEDPFAPKTHEKDETSTTPVSNDCSYIKPSPNSLPDVRHIPNVELVRCGTQDHQQELPYSSRTLRASADASHLPLDIIYDDFRTIEEILGGHDELEMASKRGLENLDSLTGSAAINKNTPSVLKVGLDAGLGRSCNKSYDVEYLSRFRDTDKRYEDRRAGHLGIDRFEPVTKEEEALRMYRVEIAFGDNPSPDYFKYGIHYNPPSNEFRTVHVGNLPESITVSQLLSRVRGGQIISLNICNTLKITGSMSALVVFLEAEAAAQYAEFAQTHPVLFDSQPAVITPLQTSTWPLSKPAYRRIMQQGQTRCLAILSIARPGLPRTELLRRCRTILREIIRDRKYRAYRQSSLESMWLDEDDKLQISFCSINAASLAFEILKNSRRRRSHTITFVMDPCSRPLDDLLAPAGPRTAKVQEVIPTDGQDLGDLDLDDFTDTEAEDVSYHRVTRGSRYRDADRSPTEALDELSYSDVNNIAVPQFGGPLIPALNSNELTPIRRVVTAKANSPGMESSAEKESVPALSTAEVTPTKADLGTGAKLLEESLKMGPEVVHASKLFSSLTAIDDPFFEEPKSLKESMLTAKSILHRGSLRPIEKEKAQADALEATPLKPKGSERMPNIMVGAMRDIPLLSTFDPKSSPISNSREEADQFSYAPPNPPPNSPAISRSNSPLIELGDRPAVASQAVQNPDEIDLDFEPCLTSPAADTDDAKVGVHSSPHATPDLESSTSPTSTIDVVKSPASSPTSKDFHHRGLSSSKYAIGGPATRLEPVIHLGEKACESSGCDADGRKRSHVKGGQSMDFFPLGNTKGPILANLCLEGGLEEAEISLALANSEEVYDDIPNDARSTISDLAADSGSEGC